MTSDLTATLDMIAHDPLVGGFALILAGAVISRMLFKQQPKWRAVARIIFLGLLMMGSSPIGPCRSPAPPIGT